MAFDSKKAVHSEAAVKRRRRYGRRKRGRAWKKELGGKSLTEQVKILMDRIKILESDFDLCPACLDAARRVVHLGRHNPESF